MIIIPVYDNVVLPELDLYFKKEEFQKTAGRDTEEGEEITFLVCRTEEGREHMTEDGFYPIGAQGKVTQIGQNGYVTVQVTNRVDIAEVHMEEGGIARIESAPRADIEDLDPKTREETFEKVRTALLHFVDTQQWGGMARGYISKWTSTGEILAALSGWLAMSNEEKYAILAEDSQEKRNQMMETAIYEFLEMSKLTGEAQSEQEEDYQKNVRQSAIRKQMDYLQRQLEAMDPDKVSEFTRLERKIDESGMNPEAEKEARSVLNRLKQEGTGGQEYGMLYDYLDFVTSLNWKKAEPQKIDLEEAEKILDEDHFGLKKVKERILQQIAVMDLNHKQSGSILLFVGAPGTGKTSIGQSIARALGRKYVRVSLGGVRDEADIRGHRRTYLGAMAGRIMDGIRKSGASNPVMVLDEVDKLGVSYNGDPSSALLEVLDPEQNNTFTDHYMNVPYDLSDVFFICTANTMDTIPEPLLNRMEVIRFSGYTTSDKLEIARRHLLPRARKENGIGDSQLRLDEGVLQKIITDFTMESGVRGLKKRIDGLCRAAAVEIVRHGGEGIQVTPDNLGQLLDMTPIRHDHILEKKQPGIVTGLAWTSAGGAILFIETLLTEGSGKMTITGQLGDVMKESAQIALSLVKAKFPVQARKLEKRDLHIHVPEGAVPKDGPSAGITLTTALASLVTGRAVSPEYAMTGEVSLRGVVMPIGGLPEKLTAAALAGITRVLIPADNMDDLRDVPEDVKKKLTIIPVKTVDEVLKEVSLLRETDIKGKKSPARAAGNNTRVKEKAAAK